MFSFNPYTDIDAVILSHAHMDHVGRIPVLWKKGYRGPIHCTYATRDLSTVMLSDGGYIQEKDEDRFLRNAIASLTPEGVAIFGMPSLESQTYASPQSKAGHVNCKSGEELKRTLERYFNTVFVFSMNDEVVHTGFYPMAHYLLGVACHRREG